MEVWTKLVESGKVINDLDLLASFAAWFCETGAADSESAHMLEDQLTQQFVQAILSGKLNGAAIRKTAYYIDAIQRTEYTRWYA